jgi:nuclear pore complex protein Nup93
VYYLATCANARQTGVIERDLSLLKLSNSDEYLRAVVLAAADQSASDSSLVDSIELYHLAGAYEKVVESVNRVLGHSLASTSQEPLRSDASAVGLSGAFGGAADLFALAQRVHAVYEKDVVKRSKVAKGTWETLGTLLLLKRAMTEFASDRPDLALDVGRAWLHISNITR